MTVTWTYSAIVQEFDGTIHEENFNTKKELEEYIGTCSKQVLLTRTKISDESYHKETTIL